jgi:hypothetical protein
MTDRLKGVVVTFEQDIREDDAEGIIQAIKRLRWVLDVTPSIRTTDDLMNRERIRREFGDKLWAVLYPEKHPVDAPGR